MTVVTVAGTVIWIVITALIIMAGIKLLKKKRDALKWSNRYAWTSLAGKAFNILLTVMVTLPAMKETMPATPGMPAATMNAVMIGSMIFGVLVTCAYPVLTLILLNRPNIKTWFANQAE